MTVAGIYGIVSIAFLLNGVTRLFFATFKYVLKDKAKTRERAAVEIRLMRIFMATAGTIWLSGIPLLFLYFWSNASEGRGQESPLTAIGLLGATAWALWVIVFKTMNDRAVTDLSIMCEDDSSLKEGLLDAVRYCPILRPKVRRILDKRHLIGL